MIPLRNQILVIKELTPNFIDLIQIQGGINLIILVINLFFLTLNLFSLRFKKIIDNLFILYRQIYNIFYEINL